MPPPPSAWRMSKTPREHQNSCPKRRTQTHSTVLNLVVMDQLREHFMRYSLLKLAAISVAALTLAACARNEAAQAPPPAPQRSEEHTSELQSPCNLVCRLLLEKKKK